MIIIDFIKKGQNKKKLSNEILLKPAPHSFFNEFVAFLTCRTNYQAVPRQNNQFNIS